MSFWEYISENYELILRLLVEHIKLTAVSVGLAILIGVPLGILISRFSKVSKPILGVANVIQAIPSMALLGFMIPLLGIGVLPATVAVVLYSLLPIIKNTYTGIESINPQMIEAAKGIGLTSSQVLTKVQIPLSLPVIMAGIRIAAVTAVGLMTMAAFIGAGGLGYLVFSGIRTVNNNQILAGAIPACLLALLVDFLLGLVEKLVTPVSLQKGDHPNKKKNGSLRKGILIVSAAFIAFVFIFTSFNNPANAGRVIAIGSKDYTEQAIIGNMVADIIEGNTDITVERNMDLGGTQVCFAALVKGDIDMYIEYSGTAYTDTLKYAPTSDVQLVYDTVKKDFKEKYNIDVLKQMGFNNTYTMAVTQETAEKYGLETISDFAKVAPQLRSGTVFEFSNREDGLPGLQKAYGFTMKESFALDGAPRYTALIQGEVDVIDAFATDGLLKKFGLKTLKDDKQFFPPYYAMPIIRADALAECPEIVPLLETLGDLLTDEIMMALNYKVDELQQTPEAVAKEFLQEQALIS
ncbi:MAG: glycine betaine ABC transporter substrate-binding protein [Christensenella sp.]|uniref:ABC transporter permease/substrate-binding protein n=1 Tax=Christensenella sp. TaxID=1935934 RepID=UPI002B1F722F|nr:glycine betaine ABC transporter substrate-binding protein [Christensenella sp.]MEA5003156.1 glycine betaine ABC transporter substrate-binding protein [Christensenella sp.]